MSKFSQRTESNRTPGVSCWFNFHELKIGPRLRQIMSESPEARLLGELVAVDTSVPPGNNYRQALKVAGELLEANGFEVSYAVTPREDVQRILGASSKAEGERVNLVARLGSTPGKTLLLNSHIDVVPPGPNWSKNPFELIREGGKLYGRGASDNKGGVAAIVSAATRLSRQNLKGNLIVALTCDEEIGGRTGLGYLLDQGLTADAAIVGDGGIKTVGVASNGCMRFKLKVLGRASHSSRNWLGVNAIEKASAAIQALAEHNAELSSRRSEVPADPESGVERLRPSLTVAQIWGGVKDNVVPPSCEIVVDRRLIPEEKWEDAKREIESILEKLARSNRDFKYELSFDRQNHFSFKVDRNAEIVTEYAEAWSSVTEERPLLVGGLGCVDSCYLAAKGVPVVTAGVGRSGNGAHSADEFVFEKDLQSFSAVVERAATRFLDGPKAR